MEVERFTKNANKSAHARYFAAFQSRPYIVKFGIACAASALGGSLEKGRGRENRDLLVAQGARVD